MSMRIASDANRARSATLRHVPRAERRLDSSMLQCSITAAERSNALRRPADPAERLTFAPLNAER